MTSYEEAWADPTNQRVLAAAGRRYAPPLSEDEVRSCAMLALWKALRSHDPSKGRAFTTSLWTFMQWECGREAEWVRRLRRPVQPLPVVNQDRADDLAHVRHHLAALPADQRRLVELYYLKGYSVAKMARRMGGGRGYYRRRLAAAVAELRRRCNLNRNQ